MRDKYMHWVTGLKGVFALIVIFRHYANGFLPALHTGLESDSKIFFNNKSLETLINESPLYLLINGSFSVFVFWTLSGLLLSYAYYNDSSNNIPEIRRKTIKRVSGVLGPIVVTYLVVYVMMKLSLFANAEAAQYTQSEWLYGFYNFPISILMLIKNAFLETFLTNYVPFNPVLWTVSIEVKGTVLLLMFLALFGRMKHRNVLRFFVIIVMLYTAQLYYICFFFGMILGEYCGKIHLHRNVSIGLLVISLILGAYPSDFQPVGFFEKIPVYVNLLVLTLDSRTLIYLLSASGVILAVMGNETLQRLFTTKGLLWMGRVSTEVYFIHIIIECSISSKLFSILYQYMGNYVISLVGMMIVSLIVIYTIAYYFHKLNVMYDRHMNQLVKNFVE